MPKVALFNQDGTEAGDLELNESVFGIEPNNHVIHEVVVMQRAAKRQGTHAVKTDRKFVVVAESLGDKKEPVEHVKVQSDHLNGSAEELFLARQRLEITNINYLKRYVNWL